MSGRWLSSNHRQQVTVLRLLTLEQSWGCSSGRTSRSPQTCMVKTLQHEGCMLGATIEHSRTADRIADTETQLIQRDARDSKAGQTHVQKRSGWGCSCRLAECWQALSGSNTQAENTLGPG